MLWDTIIITWAKILPPSLPRPWTPIRTWPHLPEIRGSVVGVQSELIITCKLSIHATYNYPAYLGPRGLVCRAAAVSPSSKNPLWRRSALQVVPENNSRLVWNFDLIAPMSECEWFRAFVVSQSCWPPLSFTLPILFWYTRDQVGDWCFSSRTLSAFWRVVFFLAPKTRIATWRISSLKTC